MMRLIQHKCLTAYPNKEDDKRKWTYGISGNRLKNALNSFYVAQCNTKAFKFNKRDDDLNKILNSYKITIDDTRIYTTGELAQLRNCVEIFRKSYTPIIYLALRYFLPAINWQSWDANIHYQT